jgi:phosphate transport system ATP-binding protein
MIQEFTTKRDLPPSALSVNNLSVTFKNRPILQNLNFSLPKHSILTVMGPSGSGKTTLLLTLNRLIEENAGYTWKGNIEFGELKLADIVRSKQELRKQIGIVFQRPTIFPDSIFNNVIFGVRHLGLFPSRTWPSIVERHLREVFLWEEVKDRLSTSATQLSIGQQQRLACARTLALSPEILLFDEPTASLDSKAATEIEKMILHLKSTRSIILVTHQRDQARRLSDRIIVLKPTPAGASIELSGTADELAAFFEADHG